VKKQGFETKIKPTRLGSARFILKQLFEFFIEPNQGNHNVWSHLAMSRLHIDAWNCNRKIRQPLKLELRTAT
jgi:hypothetical protein